MRYENEKYYFYYIQNMPFGEVQALIETYKRKGHKVRLYKKAKLLRISKERKKK